ncbi:MAG: hypothetical protein JSR65_04870 [Proteobacteria bacterium]|nr:hypothetical protein [Pseudomonadota bacterium]
MLVLMAVGPVACVSVPQSLLVASDAEGAATQVWHFGGFAIVRTDSFVSGKVEENWEHTAHQNCADGPVRAQVSWVDSRISREDATEACKWVISAVQYTYSYSPETVPLREYRLDLVTGDKRHKTSRWSWTPLGTLQPRYVARWRPEESRTRADIVDLFAHESIHLLTRLRTLRKTIETEEQTAYLTGACAQLQTTGTLDKRQLRRAALVENASSELHASSAAGMRVSEMLGPIVSDDLVYLNSQNGRQITHLCTQSLTAYFKPN